MSKALEVRSPNDFLILDLTYITSDLSSFINDFLILVLYVKGGHISSKRSFFGSLSRSGEKTVRDSEGHRDTATWIYRFGDKVVKYSASQWG